jgi:hypothetical protein
MFWIGAAVAVVAGIVALIVASFSKRSAGLDALGSVSANWIAEHRVDLP